MEEPHGQYADEAVVLLRQYMVVVKKWRNESSGVAYNFSNRIECPHPTNAYNLGILAHEIAHHELGHTRGKHPKGGRWKEELDAWLWSNDVLCQIGVEPNYAQVTLAIQFAFQKAVKRGLRSIPEEMRPHLTEWIIRWAEDWMEPRTFSIWTGDGGYRLVRAHNRAEALRMVRKEAT